MTSDKYLVDTRAILSIVPHRFNSKPSGRLLKWLTHSLLRLHHEICPISGEAKNYYIVQDHQRGESEQYPEIKGWPLTFNMSSTTLICLVTFCAANIPFSTVQCTVGEGRKTKMAKPNPFEQTNTTASLACCRAPCLVIQQFIPSPRLGEN